MNKDSKLFEELNEVVENSDMPEEDKRKIFKYFSDKGTAVKYNDNRRDRVR